MEQKRIINRYYKEFSLAMLMYVITLLASVSVLGRLELPQVARIFITLIPILPTVLVLIAILRALRNSDELIQRIQLQAVVFTAVTTGLITFSYGFLENIGFPHFPTIWILPMMFALWGLSLAYFNRRYQ